MLYFIDKFRDYLLLKKKAKKSNSVIYSKNISSDIILGNCVEIGPKVFVGNCCKIGDYSYINSEYDYVFIDGNVEIGKFCSIGPNVQIGYGNHDISFVTTHPFLYNKKYIKNLDFNSDLFNEMFHKKTIIGNDVWIGANANIKKGVTIGDGAVIGMNTVVTKDVPPYAIVVGNPGKIIKYRFKDDDIDFLLKSKWWNYNSDFIFENYEYFYSIEKLKEVLKKKRGD